MLKTMEISAFEKYAFEDNEEALGIIKKNPRIFKFISNYYNNLSKNKSGNNLDIQRKEADADNLKMVKNKEITDIEFYTLNNLIGKITRRFLFKIF